MPLCRVLRRRAAELKVELGASEGFDDCFAEDYRGASNTFGRMRQIAPVDFQQSLNSGPLKLLGGDIYAVTHDDAYLVLKYSGSVDEEVMHAFLLTFESYFRRAERPSPVQKAFAILRVHMPGTPSADGADSHVVLLENPLRGASLGFVLRPDDGGNIRWSDYQQHYSKDLLQAEGICDGLAAELEENQLGLLAFGQSTGPVVRAPERTDRRHLEAQNVLKELSLPMPQPAKLDKARAGHKEGTAYSLVVATGLSVDECKVRPLCAVVGEKAFAVSVGFYWSAGDSSALSKAGLPGSPGQTDFFAAFKHMVGEVCQWSGGGNDVEDSTTTEPEGVISTDDEETANTEPDVVDPVEEEEPASTPEPLEETRATSRHEPGTEAQDEAEDAAPCDLWAAKSSAGAPDTLRKACLVSLARSGMLEVLKGASSATALLEGERLDEPETQVLGSAGHSHHWQAQDVEVPLCQTLAAAAAGPARCWAASEGSCRVASFGSEVFAQLRAPETQPGGVGDVTEELLAALGAGELRAHGAGAADADSGYYWTEEGAFVVFLERAAGAGETHSKQLLGLVAGDSERGEPSLAQHLKSHQASLLQRVYGLIKVRLFDCDAGAEEWFATVLRDPTFGMASKHPQGVNGKAFQLDGGIEDHQHFSMSLAPAQCTAVAASLAKDVDFLKTHHRVGYIIHVGTMMSSKQARRLPPCTKGLLPAQCSESHAKEGAKASSALVEVTAEGVGVALPRHGARHRHRRVASGVRGGLLEELRVDEALGSTEEWLYTTSVVRYWLEAPSGGIELQVFGDRSQKLMKGTCAGSANVAPGLRPVMLAAAAVRQQPTPKPAGAAGEAKAMEIDELPELVAGAADVAQPKKKSGFMLYLAIGVGVGVLFLGIGCLVVFGFASSTAEAEAPPTPRDPIAEAYASARLGQDYAGYAVPSVRAAPLPQQQAVYMPAGGVPLQPEVPAGTLQQEVASAAAGEELEQPEAFAGPAQEAPRLSVATVLQAPAPAVAEAEVSPSPDRGYDDGMPSMPGA